jgi:hypothetical protein
MRDRGRLRSVFDPYSTDPIGMQMTDIRAKLYVIALKLEYAISRAELASEGSQSALVMIAQERASYLADLETTKSKIYDLISLLENSNTADVESIDVEIEENG